MSTPVSLLNGSYGKYADKLEPDLLLRLDGLYAYYHRQWWYRRQMFYHFKHCHGLLNGLALLIMALSVVVGAVWEDSLVMIGLTDLTPPTSDRVIKQYDRTFHHCPVRPKEHKLSVTTT